MEIKFNIGRIIVSNYCEYLSHCVPNNFSKREKFFSHNNH